MTTLYDQEWPTSYVDQKHVADALLDRAKVLYSRKTAITVNRYNEPSQGDWENAYVAETGLPLPIPVGTKLFWRSLKSNRVLQFGTINDSANGESSTGTVYNLLDMDYGQPSFRFLGYMDTAKSEFIFRLSNNPEYIIPALTWLPSGTFIFGINTNQIYYWMEKGLDSLLFVYRCRTADTIALPSPTYNLFFNRSGTGPFMFGLTSGNDSIESLVQQFFGDKINAAGFGTPTAFQVGSTTAAPIQPTQTANNSAANAYSYGNIWMFNVAQQLENQTPPIMPRENYHNPVGLATGSYVGATVTEAAVSISWGMFGKEDQGYSADGFFHTGIAGPNAGVGIQSSKLWVYGLFKDAATGEISE